LEEVELYVTSFYFTVTTIMTVGYGDITARSLAEKLLCILLMLIGVISFSFATGAISSIITNQDTAEAKLKEKMQTLESIQTEYQIEKDLFNRIVKAVKYDHRQNSKDVHEFMEELPSKLRIELAMAIHKKMYSNIKFFQDKDTNFIAWVGTLLRPINV
jgi:biopolymer transport protein ExbB/TolQ